MLFFYRYILGFIKIKFTGEYCEQIINAAARENIPLWGLRYNKRAITGFILVKNFKKFSRLKKGTGVKIKILEKRGLPFIINRYKNRFGFLVGIFLFFLIIEFLSSFIWCVEFSGNETVAKETLMKDCLKIGVYEGVSKKQLDPKNDAQRLLLESSKLAWAAFNVEGCVLTIDVTEIKNPQNQDLKQPSNLVATDDGIVKKIDVTSGNVLVKVGQTVKKGQVLVSGIYENMNSTIFTPSKGSVTAQVYKTVSTTGEFNIVKQVENGKIKKRSLLEAYNVKLPLFVGTVRGKYFEKMQRKDLYILGKKLPFRLYTKTFYFTDDKTVVLNEGDLTQRLRQQLKRQLEENGYDDFSLMSERVETNEKGVTLTQEITAIKNIGEVKNILVK